jgi:CsoR family transcriptional regulator, copper-sensing transcriptional repressor
MLGDVPGYEMTKDQYTARLRRIEGQVRGLQRMIEEDTYCIDVLTQIASVTKALQGVGMGLLDEHIRHCVREAASGDQEFDAKVEEVTTAVSRMLRT